jgi:hypothetical protein
MRTLLILSTLALAGCGDLFEIQAEAEEVCVRQLGEPLPGLGALYGTQLEGSISRSFPLDLGDIAELQDDGDVAARLDVLSFTITGQNGAFSGLERLAVVIAPPAGSGLPPLSLLQFPSSVAGLPVTVTGDSVSVDFATVKEDLLRYLEAGELSVQLDAAGSLPVEEWRADLEVCVSPRATYEYGP